MIFSLEKAESIMKDYGWLVGQFLNKEKEYKIDHIVVAPNYGDEFGRFLNHFIDSFDYKKSLHMSGFNPDKVIVLLLYYDSYSNLIIHKELDKYLSANNIEKTYINSF